MYKIHPGSFDYDFRGAFILIKSLCKKAPDVCGNCHICGKARRLSQNHTVSKILLSGKIHQTAVTETPVMKLIHEKDADNQAIGYVYRTLIFLKVECIAHKKKSTDFLDL